MLITFLTSLNLFKHLVTKLPDVSGYVKRISLKLANYEFMGRFADVYVGCTEWILPGDKPWLILRKKLT